MQYGPNLLLTLSREPERDGGATNGHAYAILGSGRAGTSAAYDIGMFGDANDLVLMDLEPERARRAADRVNRLIGRSIAHPMQVDVRDRAAVVRALKDKDVLVSAVPYFLNLELTRSALDAAVSMVDLGGNTTVVREQLAFDDRARRAGVALVPDCGMGPGLNVTLSVYAMGLLDAAEDVFIYDGGLPQDPRPPWNYELTFNVEGLTNEYDGSATFIREGRLTEVPALTEPERVEIPPLGVLEADVTSGGLSTAPWTFLGTLRTYQNKTLRYPGHWASMRAFRDLGLFRRDPVDVDGERVVPRHVFHALFEPQVTAPQVHDICVERVRALGVRGGRRAEALVDLVDVFDETTGFTAMERLTGWHAAIVAEMIADGTIAPGAHSVEVGVPAARFVLEARRRGLAIKERMSYLDEDTEERAIPA